MEELRREAAAYVSQMTPEEKAALCVGADFWHVRGVERLGLRGIMTADGPHGLRKQIAHHDSARPSDSVPATCFPTASAVACTFDPELAQEMGRAMGEECRAEQVSVLLGPGVNMKRSPLGGRNFEYFSEDPYLAGKIGAAMIRGMQSVGVGASLKHFALNSQESRRMTVDSVTDERALRELYFRAFEIAVKEGRPWTVMMAYNRLNGVYCCENRALYGILRGEWGFDGAAVSDWGASRDLAAGVAAGLDLEMPGVKNGHAADLLRALKAGRLAEADLDRAAENVVLLLLRAREGEKIPYTCDREAHHRLAEKIAESAAVLLKNDSLLPGGAAQNAAVIGALAARGRYQGDGSSRIHPWRLEQPLDALRAKIPRLTYAPGYRLDDPAADRALIEEAVAAVQGKDIVYLFAGLPEGWESEGYDRRSLDLPAGQEALIEAVCRANPNTAVVLQAGSPLALPWADLPRAILMLYLGGESGGSAAAKLLLGEVSPSGRLAETFPETLADTPAARDYPGGHVALHRESLFIGYRFYDAARRAPRYPFGHGLSYTAFSYGAPVLEGDEGVGWRLSCRVKNTGAFAGAEVVQLYAAPLESNCFRPVQELIGFQKIYLKSGCEKEVSFTVKAGDLRIYDPEQGRFLVENGAYELRIGASSRDIRLRCTLRVTAGARCRDRRRELPHYYEVDGSFPGEEFARLLGRPLPEYAPPRKGTYDESAALEDLCAVRPGRVLAVVLRRCLSWKYRRQPEAGARMWEQFCTTPLWQAPLGGVPRRFAEAFLALCNGRWGAALGALLGKY